MSAVCPSGHSSATTDYCDQCGARIGGAAVPTPPRPAEVSPSADDVDTSPAARRQPCPACGAARSGDDRFCEGCGYDYLEPPRSKPDAGAGPASTAEWEAVAAADRQQFERHANPDLVFPTGNRERCFPLEQAEVRIGRSRPRPGAPVPEIDLAGTPQDPGISHMHAILERLEDGSYALRDLGSTNGTTLNDDPTPIATDASVPLSDGDRIRVGAWTTITLRRRSEVARG
jgi:hypothetical protein